VFYIYRFAAKGGINVMKKFDRTDGTLLSAAGMQTLLDAGRALDKNDILKGVQERVALKPDDWLGGKNGTPDWQLRVGLNLSMSQKHRGHVRNLGRGVWRLTASGKQHMLTPEFQKVWPSQSRQV
jgi:hypothetical protein